MHQQTSFIPPFVRDLIYFDRNQYSTLDEFISNDGLLILDTIQPCLPQAVIIGHIPSSSQPEDFDPFRRSCCGVLSKLEQLIQQRVGGNLGVPEESFSRLSDIYRLKELEPWLGEAGYRAAEVWLELFVRGDYNQAWLVGSTVLEQLLVNIIFTLQGPDKFIPFLVRDLLAMPCLNQSISPTLIAVIKTLMGSPLTLNIRNLLWHGFITPRDQIPLDAYGAMLIAMTMTIADEIQKKLRNGLSIRHGCPKTEFYFRQKYNKALDEDYTIDEMALDRFDAVYERVAYNNDRELPLLLRFGRNENQSHFSALLVIEALVHTSAFVTPGTTEQWTFALQHLALDQHTPATELLILAESRAFKPAPFMFVMASLPLLEHGLRLMYVRLNGCKADRSSALIAGEYYLTLDVILDQYVPPEYYETDAAVLKDYDTSAIPNRLCSALGLQAMNLLYDLFLASLGPRIRDKTSHGELNVYFVIEDIKMEPWFKYYLGIVIYLLTLDSRNIPEIYNNEIEEIHQWMRRYTERRFDEWSTVRKETVRALCKILAYPYVTLGDNDKNMEVEVSNKDNEDGKTAEIPWVTLRLRPRHSIVFSTENTFDRTTNVTVQEQIQFCLSTWPTHIGKLHSLQYLVSITPNNRSDGEKDKLQGVVSNLAAWILIIQSIQMASEKITTKIANFLQLQSQRQLSSRSRKQLEAMRPLVPGWWGMLAGCLALVEHFVLCNGYHGNETQKNAAVIDSNEIVLNQTDKIKIEKEAETSSAEEIQLRLAIVNFLNKFVSNFERVKLGMIEAAWLDLTKVVDRHFPATSRNEQ